MQGTTRRIQLPCDRRRHHVTAGPTAKPRSAATTPHTTRRHYAPGRRGDGWSCAAPTRRACLPACPPCVVRVRAAVLCSRVRGRAAGVRSSGVRVPTQRARPFLCVVLAHLGCGRVEQPREARGTRRAALLAAGRLCDAAPPGLNRGTGLGPGAEGAEQRRNGGGQCARGSLGDRTHVGVEYRARIWHRQSAGFCGF